MCLFFVKKHQKLSNYKYIDLHTRNHIRMTHLQMHLLRVDNITFVVFTQGCVSVYVREHGSFVNTNRLVHDQELISDSLFTFTCY